MAISDAQYRIGVGAAGTALVALLGVVRFCGGMSLPAKPPPPMQLGNVASDLAAKAASTSAAYAEFIARDAAAAGLRAPSRDELARKLPYRVDELRHVLEVSEPPLALAGLELRTLHLTESPVNGQIDALALEIVNTTGADIAYNVVSAPIDGAGCNSTPMLPFNAMTIAAGHREVRVECAWRDGIALAVTRVETLEVPPLSVWYLNHVAPPAVGIELRVARGHHVEAQTCGFLLPQAVQSGLDRGEIGWRDLADFYARHRCQTYQFPLGYRALKSDGQRALPAVSAGM